MQHTSTERAAASSRPFWAVLIKCIVITVASSLKQLTNTCPEWLWRRVDCALCAGCIRKCSADPNVLAWAPWLALDWVGLRWTTSLLPSLQRPKPNISLKLLDVVPYYAVSAASEANHRLISMQPAQDTGRINLITLSNWLDYLIKWFTWSVSVPTRSCRIYAGAFVLTVSSTGILNASIAITILEYSLAKLRRVQRTRHTFLSSERRCHLISTGETRKCSLQNSSWRCSCCPTIYPTGFILVCLEILL